MHEFLRQNFGLPDGGVYSNFIASIVAFTLGYFVGLRKRLHKIQTHLHAQDAKMSLIHKHIKAVHKKVAA